MVEVLQHTISPLTASMLIFGVHKAWQLPALRAWARSVWILARHGGGSGSGGAGCSGAAVVMRAAAGGAPSGGSTTGVATAATAMAHRKLHTLAGVAAAPLTMAARRPAAADMFRAAGSDGFYAGRGLPSRGLARGMRFFSTTAAARTVGRSGALGASTPMAALSGCRHSWQVALKTRLINWLPTSDATPSVRGRAGAAGVTQQPAAAAAAAAVLPVASSMASAGPLTNAALELAAAAGPLAAEHQPAASTVVAVAADGGGVTEQLVALPPEVVAHLLELYRPDEAMLVAEHLSTWWSVRQVEAGLQMIHDAAGLPWWATIACMTLGLRMALAPVNIALLRNSLRMKIVLPETQRLDHVMKSAATEEERVAAAEELRALFIKARCHPTAQALIFPVALPTLILSIFGAVHNISMSEPSMATEGALWFPDLLAADTTYLLPVFSAITWLWAVELGSGVYYAAWPNVRLVTRTLAMAFIPVTATMPAGVFVFWLTSNLFAIARTYLTRLDSVRRLLRIPLRSEVAKLSHLPKVTYHQPA
jgi:YidC/Oxa1 family membrane protein insertase